MIINKHTVQLTNATCDETIVQLLYRVTRKKVGKSKLL